MTIEILSLNFYINERVKKVGKHFLNEATKNEVSYHKFQWHGQYLGSLITPQKYVRERWPVTITKGEEETHKRKKRQRENKMQIEHQHEQNMLPLNESAALVFVPSSLGTEKKLTTAKEKEKGWKFDSNNGYFRTIRFVRDMFSLLLHRARRKFKPQQKYGEIDLVTGKMFNGIIFCLIQHTELTPKRKQTHTKERKKAKIWESV